MPVSNHLTFSGRFPPYDSPGLNDRGEIVFLEDFDLDEVVRLQRVIFRRDRAGGDEQEEEKEKAKRGGVHGRFQNVIDAWKPT